MRRGTTTLKLRPQASQTLFSLKNSMKIVSSLLRTDGSGRSRVPFCCSHPQVTPSAFHCAKAFCCASCSKRLGSRPIGCVLWLVRLSEVSDTDVVASSCSGFRYSKVCHDQCESSNNTLSLTPVLEVRLSAYIEGCLTYTPCLLLFLNSPMKSIPRSVQRPPLVFDSLSPFDKISCQATSHQDTPSVRRREYRCMLQGPIQSERPLEKSGRQRCTFIRSFF